MAARVIESGMADIVAMGRPLLADPDWGTKIAAGKACDIRRCISCNKGCTDAIQNRQFLSCVLNAENGYENTRSIQPTAQKRRSPSSAAALPVWKPPVWQRCAAMT